jgi:hypothetical protein
MSLVIFWVLFLIFAAVVYVMTPTREQCIKRDAEALYAKASADGTLNSIIDELLDPMNGLTSYDMEVIKAFERLCLQNE